MRGWFWGGRKGGKEEREDGTRSLPKDLPLRGLEAAHKPRRGDAWQRAVGPGWAWLVCLHKGRGKT